MGRELGNKIYEYMGNRHGDILTGIGKNGKRGD
jgi:hypothetical protein